MQIKGVSSIQLSAKKKLTQASKELPLTICFLCKKCLRLLVIDENQLTDTRVHMPIIQDNIYKLKIPVHPRWFILVWCHWPQ